MSVEFRVPTLHGKRSLSVVVSVLVSGGERVRPGQPLLELETEGFMADLPCPLEGAVAEVKVMPGDRVEPGQVVMLLEGSEPAGGAAGGGAAASPVPPRAAPSGPHVEEWKAVPQATQHGGADVTELLGRGGADFETLLLAAAVKISAAALRRFPGLDSSLDPANGEGVHVRVGVCSDRRTVFCLVRDAQAKSLEDLSDELSRCVSGTRTDGSAGDESVAFSIIDLRGTGGSGFSPSVRPPQVAALGVSRTRIEPVFQEGAFVPRTIQPLSLSYDRRAVDDAVAARFLDCVARDFERLGEAELR